ncbi:unnamed protein product [Arctogadus glacialis]
MMISWTDEGAQGPPLTAPTQKGSHDTSVVPRTNSVGGVQVVQAPLADAGCAARHPGEGLALTMGPAGSRAGQWRPETRACMAWMVEPGVDAN